MRARHAIPAIFFFFSQTGSSRVAHHRGADVSTLQAERSQWSFRVHPFDHEHHLPSTLSSTTTFSGTAKWGYFRIRLFGLEFMLTLPEVNDSSINSPFLSNSHESPRPYFNDFPLWFLGLQQGSVRRFCGRPNQDSLLPRLYHQNLPRDCQQAFAANGR